MNRVQKLIKRLFDLTFATLAILFLWPLLLILFLIASIDTKRLGLFTQKRIGYLGREFLIFKIRTMKSKAYIVTDVTTSNDLRITTIGRVLRKYKLDELPQLFNVLFGQMSFVGPRPDVIGFADKLTGDDRIILSVKPGITGPATLKFKDEERLLALQKDPVEYNRFVIWPEKIKINKEYVKKHSFNEDMLILFKTLFNVNT